MSGAHESARDATSDAPVGSSSVDPIVVHACRPGDPPVELAVGEAVAIAIDRTHVYWSGPDGVRRTPKVGGAIEMLGGGRSIISIAVDGVHLYFANREFGSIWRTPKAGGPSETLAQAQIELWSLAVDDTSLYWGNSTASVDHVDRMTKSNKAFAPVDTFDDSPVSIAISAHDVVYGTGRSGTVRATSKQGGPARVLLNSESFIWDVDASGDFAYATSQGPRGGRGGRVLSISLDTQMGPTPLAMNQTYPYGIATDGASVYWTDRIDKTIRRVSVKGGPVTTLLTANGLPWDLVVDEDCVYVSLDQPGAVVRLPK